ncbi:aldehyde dehydrogenase [Annulohypoxylon truncatum]|uniref:aldehyde dehydrogenase n=1 Tax=Annulohypoxylon truncatum TaxID=327061 RepID=UPI00200804AB|nr:aldehyde dehydrogenase [Annulohypoxylon truncatum]KAI1210499.1 aldehyde dehydrogenase [Annulohypoxylon truncatum]
MASNTSETKIKLDFETFFNVIDGQLCSSSTGLTRFTVNPATLEENASVPVSTIDDVNKAVQSAQNAAKTWASTPWSERQKKLKAYADAFEANAEGFLQMLLNEQGKSIREAQIELWLTLTFLRGTADLSLPEEVIEDSDKRKVLTRHVPLGVAAGLVSWNYPIFIACVKFASALITGNAIILKPSPHAPYCNLKIAELGLHFFPPGVLQALSGDDNLGPWLVEHSGINVVSFTGSVGVGKRVMESCSKTLKRCVLELGGNDPAIVCSDVDIESTAPKVAYFAFANSGQICTIPKRVYVHESIYDKFLSAMVAYANSVSLKQDENPSIGPVSNQPQYERVKELLADIEKDELTIAAGNTKPPEGKQGFFLSPTIIDNPPDNSRIVTEEPFGPVFPVMRWTEESDVVQRSNDTNFGLGASVWSRDIAQADRIARQLQAGTVWVNTHAEVDPGIPCPGFKDSAIGVQYGVEGLKAYCNLQTLFTKLD